MLLITTGLKVVVVVVSFHTVYALDQWLNQNNT